MAIDANGQELNVGDKVFYITVRCGSKRPQIGVIEKICPQKVRISTDRMTSKYLGNGKGFSPKVPRKLHQEHSHVVKIIDSTSKVTEDKSQLELFNTNHKDKIIKFVDNTSDSVL